MIDRNRYFQPYYNSIMTLALLLLLVFVIGLVLSYLLAWRNYRPIQLLINKIRPSGDPVTSGKINELESLDRAFEHLREERDRFKKETTEEQILVRNHLLAAWLHNQYPEIKTGYSSVFWHEFATGEYNYCAITVIIDDYTHLLVTHNIKEQWQIKSTLCDILEKSCETFGKGYAMDTDFGGGIVAAICCRKNENTALAAFSVCQQLRKTIRDDFNLTLTCAIGQTVQEASDVSRSYNQSTQYIKYRFFLGWDIIITHELAHNFESDVRPQAIKTKAWAGMFVQKIRSGSISGIRQDLMKIFANIASEKQIAAFNSTYFDILSEISQLVLDSSLDKRDSFIDRLNILYENRYETVDEAIDTLVYYCEELSQCFLNIQKTQAGKDIYLKILAYIDENYNNHNLSLSMIAETFSLNASYLTRYFKERNGLPLMQYIDRLRFAKAKELLTRTDYSIREIVGRVGYTDEANFIRKFKKVEGISSSGYRSIYRNDLKCRELVIVFPGPSFIPMSERYKQIGERCNCSGYFRALYWICKAGCR
jgi:two-component system, response regulator YesN